jgi:GntR family transcriptional repressor for pyruvate dehydrogenase complex
MFNPVKKVTVTEQIMEQIAHSITSGQLVAGSQLPTERELAAQLGVTRGRVREALRALSLVGLISIKAGEGSFVNKREAPISSETIVWLYHKELNNIGEVYAARKLIESEVYLLGAGKAVHKDLDYLRQLLLKLESHEHNPLPEPYLELLDLFDLYMGELCGNDIYAKLMQTIVHLRRETSLKLLGIPEARQTSLRTRTQFVNSLESGDHDKIKKSIEELFTSARKFYETLGKTDDTE